MMVGLNLTYARIPPKAPGKQVSVTKFVSNTDDHTCNSCGREENSNPAGDVSTRVPEREVKRDLCPMISHLHI